LASPFNPPALLVVVELKCSPSCISKNKATSTFQTILTDSGTFSGAYSGYDFTGPEKPDYLSIVFQNFFRDSRIPTFIRFTGIYFLNPVTIGALLHPKRNL
jgi:hypothetical protein